MAGSPNKPNQKHHEVPNSSRNSTCIYRDEYYTKEVCKEPGVAEIIIAEQRNGPTSTAKLGFVHAQTKLQNLALISDMD